MDRKKIGERLRELRGNRTLQEVADKTGISVSTLGMYEIGQRVPRDEIKITLAKYYGRGIEEIFFQ